MPDGIQTPRNVKQNFPLGQHKGSGQFCKRIRGKLRYFGSVRDPESALLRYAHERPFLGQGIEPPPMRESRSTTTDAMMNLFLARELKRLQRGEILPETYHDKRRAMEDFLTFFARSRDVLSIRPDKLADFRRWLRANGGRRSVRGRSTREREAERVPLQVDALDRRISALRECFKWAEANGILDGRGEGRG